MSNTEIRGEDRAILVIAGFEWVKGSFFKQHRFLDQEDLLRQLQEWHLEVNTQRDP
jgi:hypothetical protein